ncbi:MAG TPA: ATPase, partial [Thermomonospora sp.]|nr:ATPase [Thermomonospora sp.]
MREFGGSRSRPAVGTAARDLFERLRWRYFQIQPGLRFLAAVLCVAVAVAAAVLAEQPVLVVVGSGLLVLALLAVCHLTMRSPAGMAVAVVVAGWLAVSVPLGRQYPEPGHQGVLLAALAVPVAFGAARLRG